VKQSYSTDALVRGLLFGGSGGSADGKADLVSGATEGDFASLTADGNIEDSGISPATVELKMDKVSAPGDFVKLDSNGNAEDTGVSEDNIPPSPPETEGNFVLNVSDSGKSYASSDFLNQSAMFAGTYNPPYGKGEYCTYNNVLYVSLDAVSAGEAFSLEKWKPTTVANQIENALAKAATVYGFHINSSESDPSACVTYLKDAKGMSPAYMDFANDKFVWGSWKNAFFIPKPCMLKSDGTVDYYLNPDNYALKLDGTASDIADVSYQGNAMMEWGQNGKLIWYKIVPDEDPTYASVYIADAKIDNTFKAWSFINNQGRMVSHFYTPIYNGTIDENGRLRSISGQAYSKLSQNTTAQEQIDSAELNNPSFGKLWYIETFADITLINLLLVLMGKSLNTQAVYGNGHIRQESQASSMLGTGTMDSKGLFWGSTNDAYGVKVFGMENRWGNQYIRYAGHILVSNAHRYKLTRGPEDGSSAADYNLTGDGYIAGIKGPTANGFLTQMHFNSDCMLEKEVGGTAGTYFCDQYQQNPNTRYARYGGSCAQDEAAGAFCESIHLTSSYIGWASGASLSCKPMS